jgi:hypothetical protein
MNRLLEIIAATKDANILIQSPARLDRKGIFVTCGA